MIQSTIIHTIFDLINTIFEANIYLDGEDKNYLYEVLTTRFKVKMDHLFNDQDILQRIEEEAMKKIRTDENGFATGKPGWLFKFSHQPSRSKVSDKPEKALTADRDGFSLNTVHSIQFTQCSSLNAAVSCQPHQRDQLERPRFPQ